MRDGHSVVLITPFDEDNLAWYARERDPAFLDSLSRARGQIQKGESVGHRVEERTGPRLSPQLRESR
jgi:hypothetical protein